MIKGRNILSTFLFLLLIGGCSKKEGTLLDFQKISGAGIDDMMQNITEDENIYAAMTGPDKIVLLASGYRIDSDDDLRSANVRPGFRNTSEPFEYDYINETGTTLCYLTHDYNNTYANTSADEGFWFRPYTISMASAANQYGTSYILNENAAYFNFIHAAGGVETLFVYKGGINASNVGTVVGTFPAFNSALNTLGDIRFIDENNGCFVFSSYQYSGLCMQLTHDGGNTWNFVRISSTFSYYPYHVLMMPGGKMIVYSKGNHFISVSADDGNTWQRVDFNADVIPDNLQYVGNGIVRLTDNTRTDSFGDIANLYESVDGGFSWSMKSDESFYCTHAKFYDAMNGIAYSKGVLQLTNDGGKTWLRRLYPVHTP